VVGPSAGAAGSGRTALLLWLVPPLIELPEALMLAAGFPEVAEQAIFGTPGTPVVIGAVLVVVVVGAVLAWRRASGPVRVVVAMVLFVAAGLTAALLVGVLIGGAYVIIALLLAHSTVCIGLIGRAVLPSAMTAGI
jgi:hypothetical protein